VVVHPYNATSPPKLRSQQECLYTGDVTSLQDFGTGDFVLPFDVGDLAKTSHMELVEFSNMPAVERPGLTSEQ